MLKPAPSLVKKLLHCPQLRHNPHLVCSALKPSLHSAAEMKSERRHKLRENELARVITKAPSFWQESGGKFLAACVAVLVVVILIRYRINSNREAATAAVQNLATARTVIEELHSPQLLGGFAPPNETATRRRTLFNDANDAVGRAMTLSDDHKIQAEALLAKADLSWTLAQLPPLPGAATQ